MIATVAPEPFALPAPRWSGLQKMGLRASCVYTALYLGSPLGLVAFIPGLSWVAGQIDTLERQMWQALSLWVAPHLLGITSEIDVHRLGTGSGDGLIEYIRVLSMLVIAGIAALVWSVADRKRPRYTTLHYWLRVYVRYSLGYIMLSYGMAKVFPGQFGNGILTLDRMLEPYGHSSPMGLLWTFMGHSRPYAIFCGAVEAIGGLLLFSQRTTMLGALTVAAGMFNVAMLNFSYDVPVKLYSSHLFLFAVFLLLPDLQRLARLFLLNQPVEPAVFRQPQPTVWRNRVLLAVKVVVVAGAVYQNTWPPIQRLRQPPRANPPRYGVYEVDTFTINGQTRAPVPMDGTRWRRVIINENNGVTVQTMDDAMVRFRTRDDAAKHTYELSTIFTPYDKILLTYEQPGPERLVLRGQYGADDVIAELRRVPVPPFLLATRGFHWVSEYPYNR